jgi:hypothetical protein
MSILVILGFGAFQGYFNVNDIEYNLNSNISESQMYDILGIEKGSTNLMFLNPSSLERKLQSNPYIKSAEVEKKYPGTLKIDIVYNIEIASIKYTNVFVVINDSKQVLRVQSDNPGTTLIDGISVEHFKTGENVTTDNDEMLGKIIDMISLARNSQVKSVDEADLKDGKVFVKFDSNFKVDFGDLRDLESSFNKFIAIYEDLKSKNLSGGVIDVGGNQLPTWRPYEN